MIRSSTIGKPFFPKKGYDTGIYTLSSSIPQWKKNLLKPTDYYNSIKNQPFIVNNNLELLIDPNTFNCYSESGTTVNDLSTNNRNGTLINGPSYTSRNSTSFATLNTDGVDDYMSFPLPTTAVTNVTLIGWVYVTSSKRGAFYRAGSGNYGYAVGQGTSSGSYFENLGNSIVALFPNVRWIGTGGSYDTSSWQMLTFILSSTSVVSIYKNLSSISVNTGSAPLAPATDFIIGRNIGDEPNGNNRAATINLGWFAFYSKVLSLDEITQNFQALRHRFGK